MEYISKELHELLQSKGMNYPTHFDIFYTYSPNDIKKCDVNPTYSCYQVIQWIFSDFDKITSPVRFLEFWYTTLLEYKFSLMNEFVGRLEEWFESNDYIISLSYIHYGIFAKNQWYYEVCKCSTNTHTDIKKCSTKQQAKHKGILRIFQIIKENERNS